jgi:Domain of Unknown Function (DUF1080)
MKGSIVRMALAAVLVAVAVLASGQHQTIRTGRPTGKGWVLLASPGLKGWKFEPQYWKFASGMLQGVTPGTKDHHYAYTEKEYSDFELHADVKLVGNNSGVCIRLAPTNFDNAPGYQIDMGEGYWASLWDELGRGMVSKYPDEEAAKLVKQGDWNHYYIRARGHHIEAWLNDVQTIDVNDVKGPLSGRIGFQLCHGENKMTEASFRNVYVRRLP